jgi:hypothetical protein
LVLGLFLCPQRGGAQAPPLSIEAYLALVDETQAVAAAQLEETGTVDVATLEALAARWAAVEAVTLADGTLIPVEGQLIASWLRAEPPEFAQVQGVVAAISQKEVQTRAANPAELASLEVLLAAEEFQWPEEEPSPLQQSWQELQRRLWAWIQDLLPEAGGTVALPLLPTLITIVGVLLFLFVVAMLMRDLPHLFLSEATGVDVASGEPLTSTAALQRARDLSRAHDYRSAVRYLYLSTLLLLEERALLQRDRTLTNREYVRSLSGTPEIAATFGEVVAIFDRTWYGNEPLGAEEYATYARRVEELKGYR